MKSACAPAYYPVHGRGVHTSQAALLRRHSPPRSAVGDVVTPELTALAQLMTEYFRERTVPPVMAAQAGLDAAMITNSEIVADLWWNVVERAYAEGRLRELVDVAKSRVGTRGGVLEQAYNKVVDAAQAAQPPAQPKRRRPPHGQDGAHLSDYRNDMRVDALQKEVADLRTVVAELRTTLQYLAIQSAKLEDKLSTVLKVLEAQNETSRKLNEENNHLPHDLQWYGAVALIIIIAIIIIAYVGGNVIK